MLESDNPPPEYKSDYMVIDLGDAEVNSYIISTINDMCYVFYLFILIYSYLINNFRWVLLVKGMWDPL